MRRRRNLNRQYTVVPFNPGRDLPDVPVQNAPDTPDTPAPEPNVNVLSTLLGLTVGSIITYVIVS